MTIHAPSIPPKPPRRPFGLNAIIVLQLLIVLVNVAALALIGLVLFADYLAAEDSIAADLDLGVAQMVTLVLTLVVNLLCAVGLWRRKRWAWFLTMLQLGVFMIEDLYRYFTASPDQTYTWTMLLNVCMVFYLNQRDVQAVFARKTPDALLPSSAGSALRPEGPRP